MDPLNLALLAGGGAVAGALLGALITWLAMRGGAASLAARDARIAELAAEIAHERAARSDAEREAASLQARLEADAAAFEREKESLTRLSNEVREKFQILAGDVLEKSQKAFLERANETFKSQQEKAEGSVKEIVTPIRERLEAFRAQVEQIEKDRAAHRGELGEQINALKELADIVAKSGRAFDASNGLGQKPAAPAKASEPAPQPRPTAPVAPAPAPVATVERQPVAPPAPAVRQSVLETPAARDTRVTAAPYSAPQQGSGWVRDLLRGASREDAPAPVTRAAPAVGERSRLHLVESLNSLSVDIARAIDHEASIELWDKYRRGERNVFTRRLYTLKGQQTFDEIRRKYQADNEFRVAVDRYCQDFERLLNDVSKNDRDNMMAQTYLTSDTGKVYTMLAHASGRLK